MSSTRRILLASAGLGAAALMQPPRVFAARKEKPAPVGSRKLPAVGVILGSVGKAMKRDPRATLTRLAELGYKELEFGAEVGLPREDFKKLIADLGLVPVAGGASMIGFEREFGKLVEDAHFFGRKYVVCYWPWSDRGENKGIDDFKKLGEHLSDFGQQLKAEGLRLAYHNHDIEFKKIGDEIPYDHVLKSSDPETVSMELDLYWIQKGGQDAVTYIRRYPGRFALFHVKDMDCTPERARTCVGQGRLDFGAMFAALAEQKHDQHFFWEREDDLEADAQLSCAEASMRAIAAVRF